VTTLEKTDHKMREISAKSGFSWRFVVFFRHFTDYRFGKRSFSSVKVL
jgi:membrane protein DedA with SNARE-associated domain